MSIRVESYRAEHVDRVRAFNQRLLAGGSDWGFYETPVPDWLERDADASVYREYFVAVDEQDDVRGAYVLKPQAFRVHGEPCEIANFQGPISEGIVDRAWNSVGVTLVQDMLKRVPLLFSWGTGDGDAALSRLLVALRWVRIEKPFCLRVVRPFRFLRMNRYVRSSPLLRLVQDVAAWTGAGSLGLRALHAWKARRGADLGSVRAEVVAELGDWVDPVWEACRSEYACVAERTADVLARLFPADDPLFIRLRIRDGERTLGWAVVFDVQMRDDARFGDLRVGTIVDVFGPLAEAERIVGAASRFLERLGVDLIASNQAHAGWIDGFRRRGFLILENRRGLAVSRRLAKKLGPLEGWQDGIHLTPADGDGPRGFGFG